jgi:hypothetical protein
MVGIGKDKLERNFLQDKKKHLTQLANFIALCHFLMSLALASF